MSGIAAVIGEVNERTDITSLLKLMEYRGIDGVDDVQVSGAALGHSTTIRTRTSMESSNRWK